MLRLKYSTCLAISVLFFSCEKQDRKYLPESYGGINTISFVAEQNLLESPFTQKTKNELGREIIGISVPEPLFTISLMKQQGFSGFARRSRNIILAKKDTVLDFFIKKNLFARPQIVVSIKAETEAQLDSLFSANLQSIIDSFTAGELREKTRRMAVAPNKEKGLRENLGISLLMPSVFFIGKPRAKNFFWASRQVKKGISNLLIYQVPLSTLKTDNQQDLDKSILKIRDSIGKKYIPGPKENMYFTTVKAVPPLTQSTTINGRKSYETKGLWEVVDYTMGGSFLCFFIEDKPHNRYIVIEGFIFAPREPKRDFLFEVRTIAESIKFL